MTAQSCEGRHVVTNIKNGTAAIYCNVFHLSQAFILKLAISNRQHLISRSKFPARDERPRQRQDAHTCPLITFRRGIEKSIDVGKGDNLIESSPHLGLGHAEDGPIEQDVLATGKLGMKPRSDLQKRRDAPADAYFPTGGLWLRGS